MPQLVINLIEECIMLDELDKPLWNTREDMADIYRIWGKIYITIQKSLKTRLIADKLIEKDFNLSIKEDFYNAEYWKIITEVTRIYTRGKIVEEKEMVQYLMGNVFLTRYDIVLEPSFRIVINVPKKKLFFDNILIKKILEERKVLEDDMAYNKLGPELTESLLLFSKEHERETEKIMTEAIPALKHFGFSEEESNLLVLAAMKSNEYKDSMKVEELVSLSLQQK